MTRLRVAQKKANRMEDLFFRFVVIFLSYCLVVMDGCGDGGDLDLGEGWEWPTTQREIGPEGGIIEVTDTTSTLYGIKVFIPEGALDQKTTIVIQDKWVASPLPAGLTSDYPMVELSPSTTFLKDIKIAFPVLDIPSGDDGEILGAFYWEPTKEKWIVTFPERFIDTEMIIETNKFGLWRWGSVSLDDVEPETATSWMENMFEGWADLHEAILDELIVPWSKVYQDPQELRFCEVQDSIKSELLIIHQTARQGVADYLATNDVLDQCPICSTTNFAEYLSGDLDCIPSVCDPTELATGQPFGWLINEFKGYIEALRIEMVFAPLPGVPGELMGILVAESYYLNGAIYYNCAWRCLLENGNLEFYFDLLASNASYLSMLGIEIYNAQEGCIIR